MSIDLLDVIASAAKSGEVLEIIYHGGSQPGTSRKIAPISVSGNKLWARCFPGNAVKSFSVSKIRFPGDDFNGAVYDPDYVQPPETLASFLADNKEKLELGGWFVSHETQPGSLNERVGVYVMLKNGKTRKHPTWALSYETHRLDEGGMVERKRKWLVVERNRNTHSFMHLNQAAEVFLKQVESLK